MPKPFNKAKRIAGKGHPKPAGPPQKLTPATLDEGSGGGGRELSPRELQSARLLPRAFYNRDPRVVGRELLGKLLIRRKGSQLLAGRIVETEAYLGTDDAAAHSSAGRTVRNAVLFGPPGHAYVYLIYGNHFCLNVSCLPEGNAGCVLIRALEPVCGLAKMARNRDLDLSPTGAQDSSFRQFVNSSIHQFPITKLKSLTSGPGRLAEALAITRSRDNGKDMTSLRDSDLYIADDRFRIIEIYEGPRVGITKAVDHPLRYLVVGNPFVSGKTIR